MAKRYRSHGAAERARVEACRCASVVLAGRPEDTVIPLGWCLATFFETYIAEGADGTAKAFGPKKPPKLKAVKAKGGGA